MTPSRICFLQHSRFDSLASLVAAQLGSAIDLIELNTDDLSDLPSPPVDFTLRSLFESDSIQSW